MDIRFKPIYQPTPLRNCSFRGSLDLLNTDALPAELVEKAQFSDEYGKLLLFVKSGCNVEFNAPCGLGKTAMAQKLVYDLGKAGIKAVLVNFKELFRDNTSVIHSPQDFEDYLKRIASENQVIVLDDLKMRDEILKPPFAQQRNILKKIFDEYKKQVVLFDFDSHNNSIFLTHADMLKRNIFGNRPFEIIEIEKLSSERIVESIRDHFLCAGFNLDRKLIEYVLEQKKTDFSRTIRIMIFTMSRLIEALRLENPDEKITTVTMDDYLEQTKSIKWVNS